MDLEVVSEKVYMIYLNGYSRVGITMPPKETPEEFLIGSVVEWMMNNVDDDTAQLTIYDIRKIVSMKYDDQSRV
jgi:hypothetical protein